MLGTRAVLLVALLAATASENVLVKIASLPIATPNSLMPSEYPPYTFAQLGREPACPYVTATCGSFRPVSSVIISEGAWLFREWTEIG